jgi:hypothetical protein
MRSQIYKWIVSSLSMFITYIFHCVLKNTRVSGCLFQLMFADPICDSIMAIRCWFHYSYSRYLFNIDSLWLAILCIDYQLCRSYLIQADAYNSVIVLIIILLFSLFISLFYFVRWPPNIIVLLLLMIMTNWLLARYWDTIYMRYEVDILTVYFFIWQFVYLI